jgi:hypothetical protein
MFEKEVETKSLTDENDDIYYRSESRIVCKWLNVVKKVQTESIVNRTKMNQERLIHKRIIDLLDDNNSPTALNTQPSVHALAVVLPSHKPFSTLPQSANNDSIVKRRAEFNIDR